MTIERASRKNLSVFYRQQGAALLVFMMLLTLSVAFFLVTGMHRFSHQLISPFHNSTVLKEAKSAVIAYARLSDPDLSTTSGLNYRYLPCPDKDGDGLEESPCGSGIVEGWLPWMSLGLAPLRDASGSCLRYFVSGDYKRGASNAPLITALPNGNFTLSHPDGLIAADIIAVIIAPGEVVGGQSRGLGSGGATQCGSSELLSEKNRVVNYLDSMAGIDNSVPPDFITAPVKLNQATSFNDTLTPILMSEL